MPVYAPYRAILQWSTSEGVDDYVVANLPETWSFAFTANWDAPWADGIINSDAFKHGAHAFGVATTTQELTSQIWNSSNSVDVTLPFIFVSRTSAYDDVVIPAYKVAGLTLPTETASSSLSAPGPHLQIKSNDNTWFAVDTQGGEHLSLHIGTKFVLESVVVTNVNVEFDTMLDKDGYPVKAKVDVSIRTHTTPVRNKGGFRGMFGIKE